MSKRQKLQAFRRRAALIKWNKCRDDLEGILLESCTLEYDPMIPMLEAMKKAIAEHIAKEIIKVYSSSGSTSTLSA